VTTGDYNEDGHLDLAITPWGAESAITIHRGKGDGTFSPPYDQVLPMRLNGGITTGDLNGDGHLDLAIAGSICCSPSEPLAILEGDGSGAFTVTTYSAPIRKGFDSLQLVDIDGDLDSDIVLADGYQIAVFRNDVFSPVFTDALASGGPQSVAIGDFDSDGLPDLVVNADYERRFHPGLGSGGFSHQSRVWAGHSESFQPSQSSVGDIDSDGDDDLVIRDNHDITVMLNNGAGVFSLVPWVAQTQCHSYSNPILVDVDRDGFLDVVLSESNQSTPSQLCVLYGTGTGFFAVGPPVDLPSFWGGSTFAAKDLDGDEWEDLVVSSATGLAVVWNEAGSYSGSPADAWTTGERANLALVDDFTSDGLPDIASAMHEEMRIYVNYGSRSFSLPNIVLSRTDRHIRGLDVSDMDVDGHADLFVTDEQQPSGGSCVNEPYRRQLGIFRGDGNGGFSAWTWTDLGCIGMGFLRVAHLNADSIPDVYISSSSTVLIGLSGGAWTTHNTIPTASSRNQPVVFDVNGDSILDLAIPSGYSGDIAVIFGNPHNP
jgi:hypothetical protein